MPAPVSFADPLALFQTSAAAFAPQGPARTGLCHLRPAEGLKRAVHGPKLIAVFAVATPLLLVIGTPLSLAELRQKIAFALLDHDRSERNIAARPIGAGLEDLQRRFA